MDGYQILDQRVLTENDYYQDENKKEGYEYQTQMTSNMFDADTCFDIRWALEVTKREVGHLLYPTTEVFNIKIGDILLLPRGGPDIQMERSLNKTYFNVMPPTLNGLQYKASAYDYLNDFIVFGVSTKTIQYKRIKELMDSDNGFYDNQNRDKEKYFNSMVMFCDPTVKNGRHTIFPHETLYLFPSRLIKWEKKIDDILNKTKKKIKGGEEIDWTPEEKRIKKMKMIIEKSSKKPVTLDIVPEREFLPDLEKYFFMSMNVAINNEGHLMHQIFDDKDNQVHSKATQEAVKFFGAMMAFSAKMIIVSKNELKFKVSDLFFGIEGDKFKNKKGEDVNLEEHDIKTMNESISQYLFTSLLNFKKIFDNAKIGKSLGHAQKYEEMRILFNTSGSN